MHIHLGPCFFYRECLNPSTLLRLLSQGKSAHAFILISPQHKEAARTLKFSEQTFILSVHTWFVPPFDSPTFYVIQLKKDTKLLLCTSLSTSIIHFHKNSLTNQKLNEVQPHFPGKVIILERAAISVKIICTFHHSFSGEGLKLSQKQFKKNKDGSRSFAREKGHRRDKWMCALARIARVDKSQPKMRVSAPLPTANAIMEMRSANQHT